MSGVFNADQHSEIEATDDPVLAARFGLTEWHAGLGQYVRPAGRESGDPLEDVNREGKFFAALNAPAPAEVDPAEHSIAEDGTENPADGPPSEADDESDDESDEQAEGGEQPLAVGTDSSTSSAKVETKSNSGATTRQRRARTTGNR